MDADISLRQARATDAAAIRQLIRQARLNPMSLDWPRFWVAVDAADQVVGCVQVKPHGAVVRELASLAVVPAWKKHGIGRSLIQRVLENEPGPLYLTCRAGLETFYQKFGFADVPLAALPPYFKRIKRLFDVWSTVARWFGPVEGLRVMRRPPL